MKNLIANINAGLILVWSSVINKSVVNWFGKTYAVRWDISTVRRIR